MEKSYLDAFRGQHVTVLTQAGNEEKTDTGTMLCVADGWLQLVKDNGEMVLFPTTAIRMLKLLDMTQRTSAVERAPDADYRTNTYVSRDTLVRSHAPDDMAVL